MSIFETLRNALLAPAGVTIALGLSAGLSIDPAEAGQGFRVELESAAVWQQRNNFAVPGNTGTRVDLPGADHSPSFAARASAAILVGRSYWVRGLLAPLSTTTTIVTARPINFQDATFPAGSQMQVDYAFNSYRASIYHSFPAGVSGEFRLGLTAKVRDAKIALSAGGVSREETDLGFVPLIYAGVSLAPAKGILLDLDIDALGAPAGYAVDGTFRAMQSLGAGLHAFVGYRILDGGADVDRVYAFGTFHYATAGLALRP